MKEASTQYALSNGIYVRSGPTIGTVPPGFYDVAEVPYRGFGLRPKTCVTDELIMVGGTVADEIYADIDAMLREREKFRRFRLTHKRGYMLHGPGGTGKTSIGLMIAQRFIDRTAGVVVFAPDSKSFYHGVSIMRDVEPGRPSLYLIEEADRIVNNTHCLAILDGELALDGAVFIAMTNYKGELPARVTNRPGRFARVVLIDAPPRSVQVEYLGRIAARDPQSMGDIDVRDIVDAFSGMRMTMDHLREAFVSHVIFGEQLSSIRERLERMAEEAQADEEGDEEAPSFGSTDWWSPDDSGD